MIEIGLHGEHKINLSIDDLTEKLLERQEWMLQCKVESLLVFMEAFGHNLLRDSRTRKIEGIFYLSVWLQSTNLQAFAKLNLNGKLQ